MTKIVIEDIEVTLDISFKKNKNTYFRFYPNNLIKVSASTLQTEKQIIQYIQNNKKSFIQKVTATNQKHSLDPSKYFLLGKEYERVIQLGLNSVHFDHENKLIYQPDIDVDYLDRMYLKEEKNLMMNIIQKLHHSYQDNILIDLSNVTYRTQRMKSRFGSCNKFKRKININLELIHFDYEFIAYIFAHEITHLVHAHHQEEFYELLGKLYPRYREVRKELKQINIR